jgi:hypothetical protein
MSVGGIGRAPPTDTLGGGPSEFEPLSPAPPPATDKIESLDEGEGGFEPLSHVPPATDQIEGLDERDSGFEPLSFLPPATDTIEAKNPPPPGESFKHAADGVDKAPKP